jgi:acetyltransferase-like isoleucine patch superfamily enzyme
MRHAAVRFLKFVKSLMLSGVWFYLKFASLLPSNHLRKLALQCLGAKLEKGVVIYSGFEIRNPWNLTIRRGSIIGHNCILDCRAPVTICENVNFSSQVAVWTAQHDPQSATFDVKYGPVTVEERAWLSFRTTVLPGVTIHEGAVLAAHAVATKDIPPFSIAAGIPAHVIGKRNAALTYELTGFPYMHMI